MKWIDINEQQPEDGRLVLVYEQGKPDCGPPNVGEYTVKLLRWGHTCGGVAWPEPCEPSHWCPVPDLPNDEFRGGCKPSSGTSCSTGECHAD